MDKTAKFEAMNKMTRELEDVKNSQTALLKKIAQLEAENINVGVDLLDKALPEIHEHADNTIEASSKLIEDLQKHIDEFAKKNNLNTEAEPVAAK